MTLFWDQKTSVYYTYQTISSNSFKGLKNLNELHLRNNSIEKIPLGIFADFQYLHFLDLSQNLLLTLAGSSFSGLPNLETLNISHNTLRDFNNFHIFPLGQLETLDISDIKVYDVDIKSILQHNVKLRELVLNDNFWQCSRLVKIYNEINIKCGGFKRPTHHFDVPNLHGIACSHKKLDSYDNLSFSDFLSIISKEGLTDDWLNVESSEVDSNVHTNNTESISIKCLADIYAMVLFLVIIIVLVIVFLVIKCVLKCLRDSKILGNRINFWYTREEETVQVCT
ncbi:hypothetical protein RI129_006201 [Pyrocoelia pectoralis]|uniref:Uncharacterized protein n=1 Tax=Pyrocoelia pectoralis TaxID=417401 RepID=A0AAN7ZPD3_9COLE